MRNQGQPKTCKRVGIYLLIININFMKRSKIFLGITTGVLAVVAFTAAKSAKFTTKVQGYITATVAPFHCTLPAVANPYYTVGASSSGLAKTASGRTIYEFKNAPCANPLFTLPGND